MKVLSLFSGVGGFDLGLERAGMETVFQCEWDKQCRTILDQHWPTVPKWDDVSTLTGAHILEHAPVIDVVAWGSPCQDLSVAGKRAGLQGERSGLFHQGVRIIKELRELTNGKYPRVSIWENVAGALSSSDGADFGQVLYEMDEAGACFSEWRLLDAQYFGVPQRRRRVFVISVFDPAIASRCPDPLLPVSEGVRGDSEEGATSREAVAGAVAVGVGSRGPILGSEIVGPLDTSDAKMIFTQYVNMNKCVVEQMIAFSHTQGLSAQPSETAWPTLRKEGSGHAVALDMAVRRLTPVECERLMGWPDNWTAGQADSHRYRQCGNGVASPVATWIGEHIMATDGYRHR